MPPLDPDELRAFARRDWDAPARLALRERALQPVPVKVRIAIALYEAARRTRPGWPDDQDRRADLAHHERVCALLRRAADVGKG